MKLFELTGVKRLRDKTPQETIDLLRQDFEYSRTNLKPLGRGAYAVAFTDGTNVFKFWHKDSAYEKYVDFCHHNTSRFLPKFKSRVKTLHNLITGNDKPIDINYVKMELLTPFTGSPELQIWAKEIPREEITALFSDDKKALTSSCFDDDKTITYGRLFTGAGANWKFQKTIRNAIVNGIRGGGAYCPHEDDLIPLLKYANPEILELYKLLLRMKAEILNSNPEDMFEPAIDRFDCAARNLAMRGDQLVILDPVCNAEDMKANDKLGIRDLVIRGVND